MDPHPVPSVRDPQTLAVEEQPFPHGRPWLFVYFAAIQIHFKPICVKSVKLHSVEEVEKYSVLLDRQTSEAVRQVRAPFPLCSKKELL